MKLAVKCLCGFIATAYGTSRDVAAMALVDKGWRRRKGKEWLCPKCTGKNGPSNA